MAVWADLYDFVLPEVPGCTTALADREIKNTVIDFIARTGLMRKTITGVDHPGGASPINVDGLVPATEQVIHVVAVWHNDVQLEETTPLKTSPKWMTQTGTPKAFLMEEKNLWLVPSPASAETDTIKVRVVVAPSQTATSFPDYIYHKYGEDLAIGAKARLLAKQKKPWTDQGLAAAYLQSYNDTIHSLAVAHARGGRSIKLMTKGRFF